jgi:hypothetical protein
MPLVYADTPLYDILNQFKCGKSTSCSFANLPYHLRNLILPLCAGHMAVVASRASADLIGIITLEDVFEELIQACPLRFIAVSVPPPYVAVVVYLPRRVILQGEIVDETDVYVDDKKLQLAHMLRSLDPPLQQAIRTSIEMERRASLERRERYTLPEHIPCSLPSLLTCSTFVPAGERDGGVCHSMSSTRAMQPGELQQNQPLRLNNKHMRDHNDCGCIKKKKFQRKRGR